MNMRKHECSDRLMKYIQFSVGFQSFTAVIDQMVVAWVLTPMFRGNVLPPSSGWRSCSQVDAEVIWAMEWVDYAGRPFWLHSMHSTNTVDPFLCSRHSSACWDVTVSFGSWRQYIQPVMLHVVKTQKASWCTVKVVRLVAQVGHLVQTSRRYKVSLKQ